LNEHVSLPCVLIEFLRVSAVVFFHLIARLAIGPCVINSAYLVVNLIAISYKAFHTNIAVSLISSLVSVMEYARDYVMSI